MTDMKRAARRLYMLDGNVLQPGDVVLSTQSATLSFAIRLFTRSRFSHAAIVLGDGMYAEAVGLGVRVRSIRTLLVPQLLVRRLKGSDPGPAQRAADVARKYVHAGYWKAGASVALFQAARLTDRNLLFCSHLVARAYDEAGAPVVERLAPDKVTPALLARSDHMADVADAVFVPRFAPDYLYSGHFESLSDRETIAVQSVYADLLAWFVKHGLAAPPDWIAMQVVLAELRPAELQHALDQTMQETLLRHGYFKIAGDALRECIIPLEQALADVPNQDVPREHTQVNYYYFQEGHATFTQQLAVDRDNEAFYDELFARTHLATFELLALDAKAHVATTRRMIELAFAMMHALQERHRIFDDDTTAGPGAT